MSVGEVAELRQDEGSALSAGDDEDRSPRRVGLKRHIEWITGRRSITRGVDALLLVALTAAAYWSRRGTLPTDGVFFDDSWVAAGAIHGRPRGLLSVGSGHPGFTAVLMVIHRLGGDLGALGLPSLIAGIVAPAVLYLVLRSLGYSRAIGFLVSAVLVVAPIHVLYSGRIKAYTLDTLWVATLAAGLPWLARKRWRWPLALGWAVGAIAIGTFSGYVLVASAAAGLMLVLHPSGDRVLRIVAVAGQGVAQGAYFLVARSKTDLARIEEVMEEAYDGHMTFSWNPITFGKEVFLHLGRVGQVFPAGPDGWHGLLASLAVAGLVIAALRGRGRSEVLAARFLLSLLTFAAVASVFDEFPFGPTNGEGASAGGGGRHTLWLVAAVGVGIAALLQRARDQVARRPVALLGADVVTGLAAVVIVLAGYQPALPAPLPGGRSAAEFVMDSAGPDDVVIVAPISTFSFSINASTPVALQGTPSHQVGFAPVYLDPRIHSMGAWSASEASAAEVPGWVGDAERVFVIGDGPLSAAGRNQPAEALQDRGFTKAPQAFGWSTVDVWTR